MTLTLDRERFTAAAAFAARALPRNATHPALTGIRIAANAGGVLVSAFDYDTYAEANAGPSTEELDVLLPGRVLASYLAGMSGPTVSLSVEESAVRVTSGSAKVALRALDLANYPTSPALPTSIGTVAAAALGTAMAQVKDAVDIGKSSVGLSGLMGLRLVAADGQLTVVGASRYRLIARDLAWSGGSDFDVLLSLPVIDSVRALTDDVVIGITDTLASFGDADHLVTVRTIAGDAPRWRQLLDTPEPATTVSVDRSVFVDALRFITSGAGKRDEVTCRLDVADGITLALDGTEGLGADIDVDATATGAPITCRYKPGYLIDALGGTDAETVTLSFTTATKPVKITAETDPAFRALAMGMRL